MRGREAIRVQIEALPPVAPNTRRHWRAVAAENRAWYLRVRLAIGRKAPKVPWESARVRLTRHSAVEPDPDNLTASWKPVLDGLRRAGVLVDDRRRNVALESRWELAPRKAGHITIEVEPLSAQRAQQSS